MPFDMSVACLASPSIALRRSRDARRLVICALSCAIPLVTVSVTFALPDDTPRTGVVDDANIIDPKTETMLNAVLLDLEQRGLAQMRIVTIRTTSGRDLHTFCMELARQWKLGDATKHNGVLMVVAVADRQYRIVTGEGIEGALTDAILGDIGRRHFVPNFRKGDYAGGIYAATAAIAQRIAGDAGVAIAPVAPRPSAGERPSLEGSSPAGACMCFWFLFIFFLVLGSFTRGGRGGFHNRRRGSGVSGFLLGMLVSGMMSGGRRGGGFGGGGFGGGFRGGGGGRFGGGGSGGSW